MCDVLTRVDGSSESIIDIIYEAEYLEHGHSDVMKIVTELQGLSADLNFGLCEDTASLVQ